MSAIGWFFAVLFAWLYYNECRDNAVLEKKIRHEGANSERLASENDGLRVDAAIWQARARRAGWTDEHLAENLREVFTKNAIELVKRPNPILELLMERAEAEGRIIPSARSVVWDRSDEGLLAKGELEVPWRDDEQLAATETLRLAADAKDTEPCANCEGTGWAKYVDRGRPIFQGCCCCRGTGRLPVKEEAGPVPLDETLNWSRGGQSAIEGGSEG